MKTPTEIQRDFDRIARTELHEGWNHNNHYHSFLLRQFPPHLSEALEVGCGKGEFARLLAERSSHVLALDLSPEMLRIARESSAKFPNIDYLQADVMTHSFPANHFDCIASIATLHHLPLADVLPILQAALKPGGVLIVLDLCRDDGLGDLFQTLAAVPVNRLLMQIKAAHREDSPQARAAWDAHGHDETYLSLREVRAACADLLPGVRVTRHLLWRYSLVWTKPA